MKPTKHTMKKLESDVEEFNQAAEALKKGCQELMNTVFLMKYGISKGRRVGHNVPKSIVRELDRVDDALSKIVAPGAKSIEFERVRYVFSADPEADMLKAVNKELKKDWKHVSCMERQLTKCSERIEDVKRRLRVSKK